MSFISLSECVRLLGRPPLELDKVILAAILGNKEAGGNESLLNDVLFFPMEVLSGIHKPLGHEHPPPHGRVRLRIFIVRGSIHTTVPKIWIALHFLSV